MPTHPGREQPKKAAAGVLSRARESLPSPKGAAPTLHQPVFVFLTLSFLQIFFKKIKVGFLHVSS